MLLIDLLVDVFVAQAGVDLGLVRGEESRLADVKARKSKKQAGRVSNRRMPVTEVLLVGGATRMPGIKRFIENVTGVVPRDTVDPDEAVAVGAAVQAGILDGQITDLMVMDVWQASLMRAFAQQQEAEEQGDAGGSRLGARLSEALVDDFDDSDDEGEYLTEEEMDELRETEGKAGGMRSS